MYSYYTETNESNEYTEINEYMYTYSYTPTHTHIYIL